MKKFLLATALSVLTFAAGAQPVPILFNPGDPNSAALGGTGVALEADAWALEHNFAAAALTRDVFAIGAAYGYWAPGAGADNRFSAGGWYRTGPFAFGLSAKGSFARPYETVTPYGELKGRFSPADYALSIGAAWSPAPGFALSATGRMVSSGLSEEITGAAFCADLSAMYSVDAFTVGVSAFNLGGKIHYGDNAYALPTLVKGGLRYATETFGATGEVDYLMGAGVMGGLGVEYWPFSIFALRGGYHFGAADKGLPSFASLGLGIFVEGFGLDLSVLLASPTLAGSFNIGISYRF
jgi:hypothetical protein